MTTDRELLELAAKAAGYTLEDHFDVNGLYWPWCKEIYDNWNPLTDDGDALRLAVKLLMGVAIFSQHVSVGDDDGGETYQKIEGDPYAATRRAIVRAAAEIGRAME